jgi:hypothetical protein
MKTNRFRGKSRISSESGQAMVFALLGLGLFLIGAMAFAVDLSNMWFNRQAEQTAADAACTAGAMDLLWDFTNGVMPSGANFTPGTNFDCNTASPTPSPCTYASLNGFSSSVTYSNANGGVMGNNVFVDFPGAVSGIATPPATIAPTPFMRVVVTNNTPTFFAGMLSGLTKQSVRAVAVCGVTEAAAPIPILVLDSNSPNASPQQTALNIQGNGAIQIFGGPSKSIQDNSAASAGSCGQSNCAVNSPWGSATIDLSAAGPNGNGADMAISGAPSAALGGFNGGTAGHWIAHAAPMPDPFAQVCFPGQATNCTTPINTYAVPAVPTTGLSVTTSTPGGVPATFCAWTTVQSGGCLVQHMQNGCPDTTCTLYEPGPYPAGIVVGNATAIFDPGLYYITGGLDLRSNSMVRPGTGAGDGSGGITFYFSGSGTVSVNSNSGSRTIDPFNTLKGPVDAGGNRYSTASSTDPYYYGVKCINSGPGASTVPANLLNGGAGLNINGNILLGPCVGYYGDPQGVGAAPAVGEQRGFLFFQDRSARGVLPSWGGGGQFLLAGTMYFHSCNSSGTGVGCSPPSVPATASDYYQDIFSLSGNSGAGTYVLGEIVTDNLTLGGTSGINMDLNPSTAYNVLKASLYQ